MQAISSYQSQTAAVLIVDENSSHLGVLVQHLEAHGIRVTVAQDSREGVERAKCIQPDLVLLEVMMPGVDGFDTCRHLKSMEHTRDIPVIFMTASENLNHKVRGFSVGAVDYINKPFQLEEVLARVDAHLTLRSMQKQLTMQSAQLQKEIAVRQRVEKSLQHIREELGHKVTQRTAELAWTNIALNIEISEHKQRETALGERDARIRRLVESNIIGIFFWNLNGTITDANSAFLRIIGYTQEDLKSDALQWTDITPSEYQALDQHAIDQLNHTGSFSSYKKEYICKDGNRVPILLGGILFEGSQDQGVAFVLDLTEHKRAEERILYLAHHDDLTGLPNRILFRDRLEQAICQAQRTRQEVAVIFIDIDNFKKINDSLGHDVGDDLLRRVGKCLKTCLRKGDSIARPGGDEFAICLPALKDSSDVISIAIKILEALRQPFHSNRHELHITGSIGISTYPSDGHDADELMRAADSAMYHAKDNGRNTYQVFMPSLNETMRRRLTISTLLHHALQHDEFVLYYQPQLDLESKKIFSAEALLRWSTPMLGEIAPTEFIQIAEETDLIASLGEWVLRQACEQLKYWHQNGHPDLCIAVNLSPYQFRRPGFPEFAARTLAAAGLPSTALEIEITEGVLMQSREGIACLEQLASMGIQLAVDDFGTGYSSLAYLQRFPLHTIKIDQSFVNGIDEDPNDAVIVEAIIALAHSLHLHIVAEGVEREEQLTFLKKHGCPAAQGYYFSEAVPAEQFTEMLRTGLGRVLN